MNWNDSISVNGHFKNILFYVGVIVLRDPTNKRSCFIHRKKWRKYVYTYGKLHDIFKNLRQFQQIAFNFTRQWIFLVCLPSKQKSLSVWHSGKLMRNIHFQVKFNANWCNWRDFLIMSISFPQEDLHNLFFFCVAIKWSTNLKNGVC